MDTPTTATEIEVTTDPRRRPYWQKIGIEIRELENRRYVGKDASGKAEYRSFGSSWLVIIPAKVTRSARVRRQFAEKKKAIAYAEAQAGHTRGSGPRAFALDDFEREDAVRAKPILHELDMTFLEAAEFARKHLRPESGDITMSKLAERIGKEKERKNLRADSLRTLKWHFSNLAAHFGPERLAKEPTRDELQRWVEQLQAGGFKGRTLKNYIRYAKQFFHYAQRHQFRADDPAALLELPVVEWKPPCILTIEETKRLLRTAMLPVHKDLLPALVLQLYVGGLRTEEVNRLTWGDLDLAGRKVDVLPAAGKNRRDGDWRTPEIPANALEFILLHKPREGKLTPSRFKDRMTALHKDAGFTAYDRTHKNAKRHSFGSYGCKLHGPSWVQDQMGHNTKPTFLKFYRNAKVSDATAKEYYALTPDTIGEAASVESIATGT